MITWRNQRCRSASAGHALLIALAACASPEAEVEPVILDGLFGEWSAAEAIIDDPPDASDAAIDILSVQGLDDPSWLYLALDVGNEVSLQSLPGTLRLLFDVDDDAGTGGTLEGMDGVDLIVALSQDEEPLVPGRGSGLALRAVSSDGTTRSLDRYALGLTMAPTWSAPRFELRLARAAGSDVPPFGERLRLKATFVQSGATLEQTAIGTYAF
jgi:hypothetical protein